MSTLCVHCDFPKHSHKQHMGLLGDAGACPIHDKAGRLIDWHPVNRFKPRAAVEQWPDVYAICEKCGNPKLKEQACTHCVDAASRAGDGSPATVHPPPQPRQRWECFICKSNPCKCPPVPLNIKPAGAEELSKIMAELQQPPPQPAGGAGEKCDQHSGDCSIYGADPATGGHSKICDCGYLRRRASSPSPSDADMEAWCDHLVAMEAQYLGKAASVERHPEPDAPIAGSGGKVDPQTRNESATGPCEPNPARVGNSSGIVAALPFNDVQVCAVCGGLFCTSATGSFAGTPCRCQTPTPSSNHGNFIAPCPRCAELERHLGQVICAYCGALVATKPKENADPKAIPTPQWVVDTLAHVSNCSRNPFLKERAALQAKVAELERERDEARAALAELKAKYE